MMAAPLLRAAAFLLCAILLRPCASAPGLRGAASSSSSSRRLAGTSSFEAFASSAAGSGSSFGGDLRTAVLARLAETDGAVVGGGGGNASADSVSNASLVAKGAELEKEEEHQQGSWGWPSVRERLQRVGRLMDRDGDARLSMEEMRHFAHSLRARQRWNETSQAFFRLDADSSGGIDEQELAISKISPSGAEGETRRHQERRFRAADFDGSGSLSVAELLAFAHPEVDDRVFAVEREYQFRLFDADGSGAVDFEEFCREAKKQSQDDFEESAALEDFRLHDADHDGRLSEEELGDLLRGHELLEDNIRKALNAADGDGDGHLHLEDELPGSLHHLLESEFVEDFFLHEHAESSHHRHDEL